MLNKSVLVSCSAGLGLLSLHICPGFPYIISKISSLFFGTGFLIISLPTGKKILSSWAGMNDKFARELALLLHPHQLLSFFRFSHIPPLRSFKLLSSLHVFFSGFFLISSENIL